MAFLTRHLAKPVVAGCRVVKRRDFEQLLLADAIVQRAKREASNYIRDAQITSEEIAVLAKTEAINQAQIALSERLSQLALSQRDVVAQLLPLLSRMVGESLVMLSGEIDRAKHVSKSLEHLKQQLQGVQWIRVLVASENVAATKLAIAGNEQIQSARISADVIESPNVRQTECVVETNFGFATVRLEDQIKALAGLCDAALTHAVSEMVESE